MREADLLDAIDSHPDDDAPRLAHADWLETNGQMERAEFIRLQLAGEQADGSRWTARLPRVEGMEWECVRGYPEKVEFRSYAAFKKGWPLTAGHRVRHVQFACMRGGGQLAQDPALASVGSLGLWVVEAEAVLAILASTHLTSLRRLVVWPHNPPSSFLARLVALPVLTRLQSLYLDTGVPEPLRAGDIAVIAGAAHLAGLRELTLRAWLDAGAVRALWHADSLRGLKALGLWKTNVSSNDSVQGGLEDLGDGGGMPGLERFRWGHDEGEDAGVAVARATAWRPRGLTSPPRRSVTLGPGPSPTRRTSPGWNAWRSPTATSPTLGRRRWRRRCICDPWSS